MRVAQITTLGLLGVSVIVNIALGTRLYEGSKVTSGDYSVYETFKTSLKSATTAVDQAAQDTGNPRIRDLTSANMDIENAIGILMGLRPEADRRGLDFGPTIRALLKSEFPISQVALLDNNEYIQQTDNTLHQIWVLLQGTTYQNGDELSKLKAAVATLNSKLWG